MSRFTALAAFALAIAAFAAPAHGAFPGDNGKIAFESDRDGNHEIYVVNPDGTDETRLTNNTAGDFSPAWSPDGSKIAFMSDRHDPQQFGCNPSNCNGEIYVMNADGSGQTRITNNSTWEGDPAWSPDGRIVFASNQNGSNQDDTGIFVMNADGSAPTMLAAGGTYAREPAWSPDGDRIAFNDDFYPSIYLMNADGTGVRQLVSPGPVGGCDTSLAADPHWSPDGDRITYYEYYAIDISIGECEMYEETWYVFSFNVDTNSDYDEYGSGESPAWGPDGMKVAFTNARGNGMRKTEHPYDGTETLITSSTGKEYNPDWQPLRPPGYARPRGASPANVMLVPAYEPCTSGNASHGPPLETGSCSPPVPASGYLTVGSPDANGQAAKSTGYVKFETFCNPAAPGPRPPCTDPGEQIDAALIASLTDVRNEADLTDYTGELRVSVTTRITDRSNGAGSVHPGTALDTPISFNMTCLGTQDETVGSTCSAQTSADALMPGLVLEGRRAVWSLGKVQVYDGGADGDADTAGDNTLFAEQGVFVP